ncbi:hypothetical protein AMAG_01617 [Allomyces macrogynus ATCC 38327]|uniref:Uncharacterized protein n=1 Tax=Allomyces macrogynus (strain ATCC 38327) TaxID=578462 RepID=A0A0L0S007_ALLM3|nr:hypothetical protein AMAG_01617 [Allomyces macrogynus ATCC 38327]|eukprot:KNE55740.1 hypothetical protein AMAG_01617 [Allomyces macrogynus ATCC 38327]
MANPLQRKILDLQQSIDTILVANGVTDGNPIAFLGALLSFLDQHKDLEDAEEERAAGVYLLADLCEKIQRPILRAKRDVLFTLLLTVLSLDTEIATTVRHTIKCLEKILIAMDAAAWSEPLTKTALDALVALSMDDRSAIRRAAHFAVRGVLAHPPPPQQLHPVAKHVGSSLRKLIADLASQDDFASVGALLTLLRGIMVYLPDAAVESLVDTLFPLPRAGSVDLTRAVLLVFGAALARPTLAGAGVCDWDATKIAALLDAIVQLKPHWDDAVLADAWLNAFTVGLKALAVSNPALCAARLHEALAVHLFPFLQASAAGPRNVTANMVAELIADCIPDVMVQQALATVEVHGGVPAAQREVRADLEQIVATTELGLSVRYKSAWPQVLRIMAALVRRLRGDAAVLMRGTLELLGDFRDEPEFPHKAELDDVLCTAIEYMGPQKFLSVLPLNIELAGKPGVKVRTYLLPLMVESVQRTELAYFSQYFIPLATHLAKRRDEYRANEKEMEAKVHEALFRQVWSLLPGFCTFPTDLKDAFRSIGPTMGNALRDVPDLRPLICTSLHHLITKNQKIAALSATPDEVPVELRAIGYTPDVAATNVRGVAVSAKYFLPLLFNVYKEMPAHTRGYVGDLISAFVQIADVDVLSTLYSQVMASLQQANLATSLQEALLDLALLLLPRLPPRAVEPLFELVLQGMASAHQKKCYKMLAKMSTMDNGKAVLRAKLDVLEARVIAEDSLKTDAGAKKERLRFLCAVVDNLLAPSSELMARLLPEVIESTKEVNNKCRSLANELVIKLGEKMLEKENDDGDSDDAVMAGAGDHGIERYVKLIAAGLVATSPMFVSATILVLVRVVYEFKDLVADSLLQAMLASVLLLINLNNREVDRAIFKLIKVVTIAFPKELVEPHLPAIINGALKMGEQHGSEFKVAIRHLFQRLCRQFDLAQIDAMTPDSHKKLIVNIRKRTERAKRRKDAAAEGAAATHAGDDDDDAMDLDGSTKPAARRVGGAYQNAFDEIVYGDSSDSEDESGPASGHKKASAAAAADRALYIAEGANAPMDFLDRRVVSNVLASAPKAAAKKAHARRLQLAREFQEGADGRLIIGESSDDDSDDGATETAAAAKRTRAAPAPQEDLYLESVTTTEGFSRQGRKIKFNHAATQAARKVTEWSDDEGEGTRDAGASGEAASAAAAGKKVQRQPKQLRGLGLEYRSKKAGGDVKRAGMPDPYAYIPLNAKIVGNRHKSVKVTSTPTVRRVIGKKIKKHKK